MKIDKNNIVFLVRSYNEATRVFGVIASIAEAGFLHICLLDDGSTDDTQEILTTFSTSAMLHVIRHDINRGAGAILSTGIEYVKKNAQQYGWEWIVTFDGDGQHQVDDMAQFLSIIRQDSGVRVIFGSRFLPGAAANFPLHRKLTLLGGRVFTHMFSGVWLSDAHNGFRMMHVEVIKKLAISSDGMEYASELIDQIHHSGYRIHECPVHITYDEYTLSKGQRFGGVVRIVTRLLFQRFFR